MNNPTRLSFIAFLALFLAAASVNAAPGFKIIEDSKNLTGTHLQTLFSSFLVNNTGTTNLAINFNGYTLTNGGDSLSITNLDNITSIANGTSQSAAFSVIIPSQQKPGPYTGTLTAVSNDSNTDTIAIRVNVTPSYSVSTTPSQIGLGSTSLNTTSTKIFNITNTGNAGITNISFGFSDSRFALTSNKTNFILPFNATETILFNITIPKDFSTGSLELGSVKMMSTELSKVLFSITSDISGGLAIEDLDVFLATRKGNTGSDSDVTDGKKLNFGDNNAGPESELRFNFNIRNTFTGKEDIDINDITVKVMIEGIDDGDDIEQESNEFDLNPNKNDDINVIISIPLSVNAGIYDITIEAQGTDDNKNKHIIQMKLKVDINKEGRDVIISKAELFPERINCAGSSTLKATIKNIGQRMEKEAKIEITNEDLGVNFVQNGIELKEDYSDGKDEFTKNLQINADKSTKAGTYTITIRSYLHDIIPWETKTAKLIVEPCAAGGEKKEDKKEDEQKANETIPAGTEPSSAEETTEGETVPVLWPETTTESSLTQKPIFWIGAILLNIIIIGAVAFLAVKLITKK